ncbi:MAG: SprT-like domain-containing protein [Bacteroidota bacterium]
MTSFEVFQKFVPAAAVNYCNQLYSKNKFVFKITRARRSKLGDYKFDYQSRQHTITINNDLNPYAFLITYLHEVAHLITFKAYGKSAAPHGSEWKEAFVKLSRPVLNTEVFPAKVLSVLKNYFRNPKAASCSDPDLYLTLKKFDSQPDVLLLKDIALGDSFLFNEKAYRKLELKRTRAMCISLANKRRYLIPELAEVKKMKLMEDFG